MDASRILCSIYLWNMYTYTLRKTLFSEKVTWTYIFSVSVKLATLQVDKGWQNREEPSDPNQIACIWDSTFQSFWVGVA